MAGGEAQDVDATIRSSSLAPRTTSTRFVGFSPYSDVHTMIRGCFRRSPRRYKFYKFCAPAGPARRISETSKTCATVEIGRLHFEADRSLGRQLVVCVVRSVRARSSDGSPTAWQHYMLIVVGVVHGRPRRRLGDDACVGLRYAVAALVNYDVGAARRAAWSCRGGSSKRSSSMALGRPTTRAPRV